MINDIILFLLFILLNVLIFKCWSLKRLVKSLKVDVTYLNYEKEKITKTHAENITIKNNKIKELHNHIKDKECLINKLTMDISNINEKFVKEINQKARKLKKMGILILKHDIISFTFDNKMTCNLNVKLSKNQIELLIQ